MTCEEYNDTVQAWRSEGKKAKVHLELNLAKDVKGSKKGLYKCISSKQKIMENVNCLMNRLGVGVAKDMDRAELVNATLASAFFFLTLGVFKCWNRLSREVVECLSMETFKTWLNMTLRSSTLL